MRPIVVELSAAGLSRPIPVDFAQPDFKLTLQVGLTNGATLTYSVQNTADDPYRRDYETDFNTDADWFNTTGLAGLSASAQGNIFFPVQAVRLNVTAYTSGTARLTVLQQTGRLK